MKMLMRGICTMALVAGISGARISQADCEPTVWDLTAGQTEVVGTVTVYNDEENLYITYKIADDVDAVFGKLHYWVGASINDVPKNKAGNIVVGHLIEVDATGETEVEIVVNWAGGDWAEAGDTIAVVTHAEIQYLAGGVVVGGDTAFGGDEKGSGRRWWYYGLYTICDEEVPPEELEVWEGETAWAAGPRYVERGSWATYTPYVAGSTVDLLAGQTMLAGVVSFSDPLDGWVTIAILLNGGWRFALEDPEAEGAYEPVKVQDYADAPTGNPAPGQFEYTAAYIEGDFAVIVVPENNFYGIHVDVEWLVE